MEKHILILEDSPTCQVLARESLKQLGPVEIAGSCKEARRLLSVHPFDLILIDMNLPDGNGFEFYGELLRGSEKFKAAVIFATADEDISKKVAAFAIGASDYLTKPYSPLELRARAERIFRSNELGEQFIDEATGLNLNMLAYKASRRSGDQIVALDLTPNEFKILSLLLKQSDRVFSRNQMINSVWGDNVFITERTVDSHIYSLRKKLGHLGDCIVAIRGEGYVWRYHPPSPLDN